MSSCQFKKYYKEGDQPYHLLVTSVFYYDKYKRFLKGQQKDVAQEKQLIFLKNLTANIKNFDNNFFPDNWIYRIYFDKSLLKFKYQNKLPWKIFLQKYKSHPKVQFIEYQCPKYHNTSSTQPFDHQKLFGTLIRFHPLFQPDPKILSIHIVDADNYYTEPWLNELKTFIYDPKAKIHTFCSQYEFARYRYDILPNYFKCYFRAGMFSTKVTFPPTLWDYMFEKANSNNDFLGIIQKIYEKNSKIFPSNYVNKKTYERFEFGYDEVILNYFIKKFIYASKYPVQYSYYQPSIPIFIEYLVKTLDYPPNQLYTKELLDNLHKSNTQKLLKDMKQDHYKKRFFKSLYKLKKNLPILKKMDIEPILIDFISNYTQQEFIKYPPFQTYFDSLNL